MPKFQEYESQVSAPGPMNSARATPEAFGAGIGQGLTQLGNSSLAFSEQMVKNEQQKQIADVSQKMAQAHADAATDWQNTLKTADPNDPDFPNLAQQHLEDLGNKLDDIGANAGLPGAQRHFQALRANIMGQQQVSAFQGQAQLAGIAAKNQYQKSMDGWSSTLIADPSAFDSTKKQKDDYLETSVNNGGMTRAMALELGPDADKELAKSAVDGMARIDPDTAKAALDSGKFDTYLNGDAKRSMYRDIHIQQTAQAAEKRRLEQVQADALAAQQDAVLNSIIKRSVDNPGSVSPKEIANSILNPVGSGSKMQMIELVNKLTNDKKMTTDPDVFTNLFQDIHRPDGDPNKLTDENELNQYLGDGLDMPHLSQLRAEIQSKKTPEGEIEAQLKKSVIDIAEQKLVKKNPMIGLGDPAGQENYTKWLSGFLSNYDKQKAAGKSPQELLTPDSPDYLGKDIGSFVKTPQQIMQAQAEALAPNKPKTADELPIGTIKVYNGERYRFKGGDKKDQKNWEKQ